MPSDFVGEPAPLRMVLATVGRVGPAAFVPFFSAANADGGITIESMRAKAIRALLRFIIHQDFYVGISV